MLNAHKKCRIQQNEVEFNILNAHSTFERFNGINRCWVRLHFVEFAISNAHSTNLHFLSHANCYVFPTALRSNSHFVMSNSTSQSGIRHLEVCIRQSEVSNATCGSRIRLLNCRIRLLKGRNSTYEKSHSTIGNIERQALQVIAHS